MQEEGGVCPEGGYENFSSSSAMPTATERSGNESLSRKKVLAKEAGRAPLSSLELSTGTPLPRARLPFRSGPEREPQGGPKMMPFGNSDSFGSGGCLLNVQNVSQRGKFVCSFPTSLPRAASPSPLGGSRGQFYQPAEVRLQVCFRFAWASSLQR